MGKKLKDKSKWTKKVDSDSTTTEELNESTETEIKVEKKSKKETPKEPVSNLPLVPLEIFCRLSGKKLDQMAGFRRFALTQKMKPMTIPQWRKALVAFENRPMR